MNVARPKGGKPASGTPTRGRGLRSKDWWERPGRGVQGTVVAAAIAAVATVIAALVTNSGSSAPATDRPSGVSSRAGTASTIAPRGPKPDCPGPSTALPPGNAVDITNLKDDDPVDYGVTDVKGTATLLPGNYLWFFVWAPTAERMYVMGGRGPAVENGLWIFNKVGLGDGSGDDTGKYFCMTAMIVNAEGNRFLEMIVAMRADTAYAMTKDEIPAEGLAKTIIVFLRNARMPEADVTS